MLTLVIALLILWVILGILGFAIKGLLWLAVIALVLFVITAVVGFLRRAAGRR